MLDLNLPSHYLSIPRKQLDPIGNELTSIRRRRRCLSYQNLEQRRLLATLFSESFDAYDGSGFASSPSSGQLDSDFWKATGLSEGDGTFGGNYTSSDFAGGYSNGGISSGGIYAFDVGSNPTLGVQPSGSDMTPGAIGLQLTNTTGASVDQWTISYDLWVNNNEQRGNSVQLSYSTDDSSYVALSGLDFVSPAASDSAGWTLNTLETTFDVTVANGAQLFFRWSLADDSGGGSRDEFGFDDIVVSTGTGGGAGGGGVGGVQTQDLRIVSYNIANSPQNSGDQGFFSTVFSAIGQETRSGVTRDIDLLVIQETDPTSLSRLESVMDSLYSQNYTRSLGINSSGDYFGFIYNTETLMLLETENVSGNYTRDPYRGLFRPVGASTDSADFQVFNVHLNATNASTRQTEANGIRSELDSLGSTENVFVIGDLNIDSSSESSYQILTGAGAGQVLDPISSPGNWHNNTSFKSIHTQNPAGPMDDRFDFQLVNDDVLAVGGLEIIPGSYRAFGNNGSHTFDQAITTGNGASNSVLSALANASDHLPVVVDYRYQVASIATAGIFYEGSSFDTASDLDSTSGKAPLLPGQTATFENYHSYSKGINGMVLEVNELPTVPNLGNLNQFFEFKTGNSDDVSTWASAASPTGVTYQSNVDSIGTDLIFLTWADEVIKNIWLEVTFLSNSTTGLTDPSVFYFGNIIGETGNDPSDAIVNLADVAGARQNQTGFESTDIENDYDFNRDAKVNLIDIAIARQNQSGFSPVNLITPSSSSSFVGFGSGQLSAIALTPELATEPGQEFGIRTIMNSHSQPVFATSNKVELSLAIRDEIIQGFMPSKFGEYSRSLTPTSNGDSTHAPLNKDFLKIDNAFGFFDAGLIDLRAPIRSR